MYGGAPATTWGSLKADGGWGRRSVNGGRAGGGLSTRGGRIVHIEILWGKGRPSPIRLQLGPDPVSSVHNVYSR